MKTNQTQDFSFPRGGEGGQNNIIKFCSNNNN